MEKTIDGHLTLGAWQQEVIVVSWLKRLDLAETNLLVGAFCVNSDRHGTREGIWATTSTSGLLSPQTHTPTKNHGTD